MLTHPGFLHSSAVGRPADARGRCARANTASRSQPSGAYSLRARVTMSKYTSKYIDCKWRGVLHREKISVGVSEITVECCSLGLGSDFYIET